MARDQLQTFQWTAVDAGGKRKRGRSRGTSEADVITELESRDMLPITVSALSSDVFARFADFRSGRMKASQLATFARQLHMMLRVDLPLPKALDALAEEAEPGLAAMLRDISERCAAGWPLSRALGEYPKVFDEVFRSYILAGETTGSLPKAVGRLAHVLEQQQKMRTKVKAVTAYPKMVAGAIMVMVVAILAFLVPRYAGIYKSFGAELPAPTQLVVNISNNLLPFKVKLGFGFPPIWRTDDPIWQSPINFLSPVLWIGLLVGSYIWWRRRNRGNLEIGTAVERIKFRLPLVGKLSHLNVLYRWSSTLNGALDSDLPLPVALQLAADTSGSEWIQLVSEQAIGAVQAGRPLSTELARHDDLFPSMVRALIVTGEEAGEYAEMFAHIAGILEEEIDALVATLGAKIEVALLMVMGGVVGSLLVVLYLPILNLSQVASKGYSGGGSTGGGTGP